MEILKPLSTWWGPETLVLTMHSRGPKLLMAYPLSGWLGPIGSPPRPRKRRPLPINSKAA